MANEKTFEVGSLQFSALRKQVPIPHWVIRINETGEVLEPGAGGISTESVPKMQASVQELFERVSKNNVPDFRKRFGLPAEKEVNKKENKLETKFGIYNEYAEEFWKEDDYKTPKEFTSHAAAAEYLASVKARPCTYKGEHMIFGDTIDDMEGYVKEMNELQKLPALDEAWSEFSETLGEFGRMESPEEFDEFCIKKGYPYTYLMAQETKGEIKTLVESCLSNRHIAESAPKMSTGMHCGLITKIEDGFAVQKIGRDPDKVVRHELARLSAPVAQNDVVDIIYSDGMGTVLQKERGVER